MRLAPTRRSIRRRRAFVTAVTGFSILGLAFANFVPGLGSGIPAAQAASDASITVHKAGDRKSDGSLAPLSNATFTAYTSANLTTAAGNCTTAANGECTISDLERGTDYWVKETAAPAPFSAIAQLYTSGGGTQDYVDKVTTKWSGGSSVDTRTFADRRENPALPNVCGLKVALVFDLSNSISSTELAQMKTAAKDFVTTLEGTPSSFSGFTFATAAPAEDNSDLSLTSIAAAANANAVRTWIDNRTLPGGSDGATNWDLGLRQLEHAGADLVLFLTDGSPTLYGTSGGDGSTTHFREVEEAVASANLVKSTHQRIVPVGVGLPSGGEVNLQAISGPTLNDDYFLASDYAALKAQMLAIATKLCGGTVSVTKQVQTGPDTWENAANWTFDASPNATPASGITDANGAVSFDFDDLPKTVTVSEQPRDGYAIVPQDGKNARCVKGADNVPVATSDVLVDGTRPGVSFTLASSDAVRCSFHNAPQPARITIRKATAGGVGGAFTLRLTGPNGTDVAQQLTTGVGTNPVAGSAITGLFPGTYVLSEESLPSGWTLSDIDCGTFDLAKHRSTITLAPGADLTCTATNTSTQATISVTKTTTGSVGGPFTFQLNGDGPSQLSGSTDTAGVAKTIGSWSTVPSGPVTVSELSPSGWSPVSASCRDNAAPDQDLSTTFTPAAGHDYVCAFVNQHLGSLTIHKTSVGGVGTFTFGLTHAGATTDHTVTTTSDDPAATVVNDLEPGAYSLAETGLDPHLWDAGPISCYRNGSDKAFVIGASAAFTVNPGDAIDCRATNVKRATVTVKKVTVGGDGTFTFDLTSGADSATSPGIGNGGAYTWPSVTPGAELTLAENAPTAAGFKLTGRTCVLTAGPGTLSWNATGSAGVSIDPKPGQAITCTFTNQKRGTLTVEKTTVGGTGSFTVTAGTLGTKTLDTTVTNPAAASFDDVDPGTYLVEEAADDAWVARTECFRNGATKPFATGTRSANVEMAAGDTVLCKIENTRVVDLGIVKRATSETSVAGTDLAYRVTVTNHGPTTSHTQGFTDALPAGLTLADPAFSDNGFDTCAPTVSGGITTITCTRSGSLVVDASVGVTIHVHVAANQVDGLENCARLSGDDNVSGEEAPDRSCTTTPVRHQVDLAVDKTGPATIAAGGSATYTLRVDNLGPSDARADAELEDALPAGMTVVDVDAGSGVSCTFAVGETNFTCTIAASRLKVASDPVVITLVAKLDPSTSAGPILNRVTVGSREDPAPCDLDTAEGAEGACPPEAESNGYAQWPSGVLRVAPLQIVKGATASAATPGAPLTYTLKVTNPGPSVGEPVRVTDTLPAGTRLVSLSDVTAPDWDCSASNLAARSLICDYTAHGGQLPPAPAEGSTSTITVKVSVDADYPGTKIENCAEVFGAVSQTAAERAASISAQWLATEPADTDCLRLDVKAVADLQIVKDAPATVTVGNNLTYTLKVTNHGPSDATGVTVTDPLPTGVAFVSAAPGCSVTATTVKCVIGKLALGATTTRTITVSVPVSGTASRLENAATVAGDQSDPVLGNNRDTAVTDTVVVEGEVAVNPTRPPAKAVSPAGTLPLTGGQILGASGVALLLLGLGTGLVAVTRRRRRRTT